MIFPIFSHMKMRYRTGWDFPTLVRYHLLWLGVCAGLLLLFLHSYKRGGGRRRLLAERGIGIFLVGLEVYRIAVLALIGKCRCINCRFICAA